jgi:hypothetical protein
MFSPFVGAFFDALITCLYTDHPQIFFIMHVQSTD